MSFFKKIVKKVEDVANGNCSCTYKVGPYIKGIIDAPGLYRHVPKGKSAAYPDYIGGTVRSIKTRTREHVKAGKLNLETHDVYSQALPEGVDVLCAWPQELKKIHKYKPSGNKKMHIQRKIAANEK